MHYALCTKKVRQFSERVKKEILNQGFSNDSESLAFLSAFARVAGAFGFSGGQKTFEFKADKEFIKIALHSALEQLFRVENLNFEILEKSIVFKGLAADELLQNLKIFVENSYGEMEYSLQLADSFFTDNNIALSVLKAFFIGGGFITLVKGYHLEFAFSNGFLASDCIALLKQFCNIVAKQITRAGKEVVYIKGQEQISEFLTSVGATDSMLNLENISAERESAKLINRRLNCDMANIDKTVELAAKQIAKIENLQKSGKLATLSQKLIAAAELRLQHPEASLDELAEKLFISKSGIRHRLQKLMEEI